LVIEKRVKRYKVKVQYQLLEEEEKKVKREAIAQVILQSLRWQKEGKWKSGQAASQSHAKSRN